MHFKWNKILLLLLVPLLATIFFIYTKKSLPWNSISAQVPVERNDWRVLINPESYQALTQAKTLDENTERLLLEGNAHTVWAAITLSEETVKAAAKINANNFILGWLKGSYTIWVNGVEFARRKDRFEPYVLSLPAELMSQNKKIEISIQLQPREGTLNILPFTIGSKSGFATAQTANSYLAIHDFLDKTKPLALLFFNLLGAIFFALLFNKYRDQEQFIYLAGFFALNAIFELPLNYQSSTIILIAKSAFAMNLGFLLARTKVDILKKTSLAYVLLGASFVFFASTQSVIASRFPLYQVNLPFAYWIGGMACMMKATWGKTNSHSHFFRLMGFSSSLFALGALSILQSNPSLDIFMRRWLTGLPELFLLTFIGFIAHKDLQDFLSTSAEIIPFPQKSAQEKKAA